MDDAATYVADHARSVLVTRRRDGGLQASPVRVLLDDEGRITATTRAATAKAKNLARDARFTLCVFNDTWTGGWMTIEGQADIVRLPDALPMLRAFYERRDGKIADAEEFEATMTREGRLMLVFTVTRNTPLPAPRG
jgi:PPOX class probable F420-dependent enzyme